MNKPRDEARAARVWKRMTMWYGTRWSETYGPSPSDDWKRTIADADDMQIMRGLATIKSRHLSYPPTLPEFEAALRAATHTTAPRTSPTELLERAAKRLPLTERQRRGWMWIGTGDGITGLRIPADGPEHPAHSLTLADLASEM